MVSLLHKTLVVILFFILLSPEVYAISLGSTAKNKFAEISDVESVKFKMLFWNVEEEPYTVELSVKEAPKDWIVIIDPDEFILNKSIGEEYIKLPYISENIRTKVVNLFVKPVRDSKPGKYFVLIKAETELPQNEKNGIAIIPGRLFKFEIDFKGFESSNNIENKEIIEFSVNGFDSKNEDLKISNSKNENQINKKYFYFIITILIILTSIIIYKKS